MIRQWLLAAAGLLFLCCVEAVGADGPPAEPPRGVVFVVGGIGGLDPIQTWGPPTFRWAGVPGEVRLFRWTHGKARFLRDLQDTRHLLVKAGELADAVRTVLESEPGRPVYLVGHSAGAALILAAAERLPPNSLERIILLSAAVSPGYDLRPALGAVRGEVVAFSSTWDWLWLGWGTSQFGTADRVYGPSAGLSGFRIPEDLDAEGRERYMRLVQVRWGLRDLLDGCGGAHHSTGMPLFLATQVAPWLRPAGRGEPDLERCGGDRYPGREGRNGWRSHGHTDATPRRHPHPAHSALQRDPRER
jgi:pimeloyl-ACP methyl ester carboxylesterase